LIADKTVIPEEDQSFYTEKILYMPHCYQINDRKREASPRIFTKQECSLPENVFVFCCFNNGYKITPTTFESWMNILKACPDSVLWLLESQPEANGSLRKEALLRGIDPNRLVFASRVSVAEHLSRIQLADLFLDTAPYNAHTTCSDALWMGVPVLTQYGKTFPGRVAASLLKAIKLPELITQSTLEYEQLAIKLQKNPERLDVIKAHLRQNKLKTNLFNTESFISSLEDKYCELIDNVNA
jgi:predicted O-linked N-acetylglucosamine transferase (SPINDLY family)